MNSVNNSFSCSKVDATGANAKAAENISTAATTVFHCALHSRIGSAGAHFEHKSAARTWRDLKSELEQRLLGRSIEADYALEQRARAQRRDARLQKSNGERDERPHQQQLKGKVVGSSRERVDEKSQSVEEVRARAKVLPWLSARALLEPGDILVLWRLPRQYDATQRIYDRKAAIAAHSAKKVPQKYRHLLRLQLAEASEAGVIFGEHQWVAADQQNDSGDRNGNNESLQFNSAMSEDERIALLTKRAAQEYGVTAQQQAQMWKLGPHSKKRKQRTALPPENYVCVRCSVPGHWVHDCPTRHDARFEPRNILSTNGIARSRLRRVQLDQLDEDFDGQLYRDQEGRFYVQHHNTGTALREKRKRELEAQILLNPSSL